MATYDGNSGREIPTLKNKCKHCGEAEGYYVKIRYSGTNIYRMDDDNDGLDNYEFYDGANWKEGKTKYCNNCDKPI